MRAPPLRACVSPGHQLSDVRDAAVSGIARVAAGVKTALRPHAAPTGDTSSKDERDVVTVKASVPLALQKNEGSAEEKERDVCLRLRSSKSN